MWILSAGAVLPIPNPAMALASLSAAVLIAGSPVAAPPGATTPPPFEAGSDIPGPFQIWPAGRRPEARFPIGRPQVLREGPRLQCAIYARRRSGLALNGAARGWWAKAAGRYQRAHAPAAGAVVVLTGTRGGHVAVVAAVLSSTEILVDHANWMNRGEIELGALMEDVSAANDWSRVRVWHPPSDRLGHRAYPVLGFILPVPARLAGLEAR